MVGHAVNRGRYPCYCCEHSVARHTHGKCENGNVAVPRIEETVFNELLAVLADPACILDVARRLHGDRPQALRLETVRKDLEATEYTRRRLARL